MHTKVEEQEIKLEASLKREDILRDELDDTKKLVVELKEEIKIKDEIILDLRDRLAVYEPEE